MCRRHLQFGVQGYLVVGPLVPCAKRSRRMQRAVCTDQRESYGHRDGAIHLHDTAKNGRERVGELVYYGMRETDHKITKDFNKCARA